MEIINPLVKLKNDSVGKIYFSSNLADSNATGLMLRVYAELIEKKFSTTNSVAFDNNSNMLWIEVNEIPVGGICFSIQQHISQVWIILSFTDPNWRNQGINQICQTELEKKMKKMKLTNLASHVHMNNTSRIAACKKMGMIPEFYRMSKRI